MKSDEIWEQMTTLILPNKVWIAKITSQCITTSNDCLEWPHYKDKDGYGRTTVNGKCGQVHRQLMKLFLNRDLLREEIVRHKCHNPSCCNVDHLCLGTHADNMRDKITAGRSYTPQGEKHWRHKLSSQEVKEIKYLHAEKQMTQVALAQKFGVKQPTISDILRGRTWGHVQ